MGWRLRRVLGWGPFRATLSRSGIGWSVGFPGLRVGVSAFDQLYCSVGLPGSGIYWIKYFGRARLPSSTNVPAQNGLPPAPAQNSFPPPPAPPAPAKTQPGPDEPWWKQKNRR
jgi:hypothetical protein